MTSRFSMPATAPDDDAKMFDLAPVSLWIEDFSAVKALFEQWRAEGVGDIKAFLAADPGRVRQCSKRIRILRVNRKTLSLFGARDLAHLMAHLGQVMRDDTFKSHVEEFVPRCMSEIRVLDVNSRTLELFGAPDKETLLRNLADVFRDEMGPHFREQLVDLWDGKLFQQREVVNYALDGTKLHLLLQFSVLPNHERDWSLV